MADSVLLNKIMNIYEEKRTAAANERQQRIKKVYEAVPEIDEIDNEIFRLGMENTQKILKNPEKSEEYNNEFKEKLDILNKKKKKLMSENNIPEDYDKYRYSCNLCNDTGYTPNGKKCVCFEQQIINEAYSRSNLGEKLKKQNFDTFSFDYYSKQPDKSGISPYDNIKRIFKEAKIFCDNFENDYKNLLFNGNTGLGKTFLSSCIAKEIIEKGKTVVYLTASKLFSAYEDYKFGRNTDKSVIDNIYNSDLLIIDDLGTEAENKINNSFLFDVMNERLSNGKKMIISTNFSINELDKAYSKRFTSRLFEYFIVYTFTGEDIRLKMLKNR